MDLYNKSYPEKQPPVNNGHYFGVRRVVVGLTVLPICLKSNNFTKVLSHQELKALMENNVLSNVQNQTLENTLLKYF